MSESTYIVRSTEAWWSNTQGWVDSREDADRFTEDERHRLNPPIGAGIEWVAVEDCDYAGCSNLAQGDGRPFCLTHHNTDEG